MKFAETAFEELLDAFDYCVGDYLHDDVTPASRDEAVYLFGAAAFLIDNLIAKENAGAEITKLVKNNVTGSLDLKKLSQDAVNMKLELDDDDFAEGKSVFRDYLTYLAKDDDRALDAFNDLAGKLALIIIDKATTIMTDDLHEVEPMHVAELALITLGGRMSLLYRELYSRRFLMLSSIAFFLFVEEQSENIRTELLF
ncbi:MAG: hypothetical protein K6F32_00595 [Bacilli bacterium]|nr:hypothetical protein [Bacilli bacterium]